VSRRECLEPIGEHHTVGIQCERFGLQDVYKERPNVRSRQGRYDHAARDDRLRGSRSKVIYDPYDRSGSHVRGARLDRCRGEIASP